jgi:enterobactin synthetase component D
MGSHRVAEGVHHALPRRADARRMDVQVGWGTRMGETAAIQDFVPAGMALAIERIEAADLQTRATAAGIPPLDSRAVPRRQREYLAGRLAAHAALHALGAADPRVGRRDQAPAWPAGWCGSISHSTGLAVAIAAPTRHALALGIDIEARIEERRIRVVERVMAPDEQAAARASGDPWIWTRAWAAKEAAFKCLSALGHEPHLHTLVPRWSDGGRGEMRVAADREPVRIELDSRIDDGMVWMLARVAAGD